MTATLCHLAAYQRLKLGEKKGFGEESRTKVTAVTPKLFEELM